MLYDQRWNRDIYSIKSLLEWLEQQPKDKRYQYTDARNCATAQYLRAHGVANDVFEVENNRDWFKIVVDHPRTFGAATRRARRIVYGPWYKRMWRSHKTAGPEL